ncbi:MAG: transposase, partial [Deltaproteobacteria bacterium]
MYVTTIPNRNSPPAILLRESYRENGKVKNRTLANLSSLPPQSIDILRRSLKGENLVSTDVFEIVEDGSPAHGHVDAVMTAMRRLDFSRLICSRHSRRRDLVVAMVTARILEPKSKLATTVWWADTTLPEILNVSDADEDDLYDAMDWLLERQNSIENKLASRHLENNALALYDLTSSYFEGKTCPLAALGHNRDGKKGKLQVNYGLLTNRKGIPVAVSVFEGNTGDPKTLMPQVEKMQDAFGIKQFVMVGDRGMLTQKQVDVLHDIDDVDWIGALRPEAIKKLVTNGAIQMGLFDERNLFELKHPDFPGERLIACRNAELAHMRAIKRESLLQA